MGRPTRRVEDCPHRHPSSDEEAADCRLLGQITGIEDDRFSRVGRDACEACCRSFLPSEDDANPVVASLLYDLTSRVMEQGGVAGCDRRRAEELNLWAMTNVPSEEDCLDGPVRLADGPMPEALDRIIPAPRRRSGPRVRSWAVGVTTAPRSSPTLTECLSSLANAGWDRPRLFVDGPLDIPEAYVNLPRTNREPRVGAWPNYYLSLAELLMRGPEADAYMIAQDDALFADFGVRDYLERILWPGKRAGIVSLYCSRAYTQAQAGWYTFEGSWLWGATAFVFSVEAARRFLADLDVVRHRWSRLRDGLADIDWRIGRWASRNDVPVSYPTPSLVQHIGDVSSLWKGRRAHENRRADWFAGRRGEGDFREKT